MPHQKAIDILGKHNLSLEDVKERKTSLHHLRKLVREETLPFDVFRELVKLRR
jgi:hypothetical protein